MLVTSGPATSLPERERLYCWTVVAFGKYSIYPEAGSRASPVSSPIELGQQKKKA